MKKKKILIGSRKSKLALYQAGIVLEGLRKKYPAFDFRIKELVTDGDRNPPFGEFDRNTIQPGLFTRRIEKALLAGEIDLAVHSAKDLPTQLLPGLSIGAVLERGETREAWISSQGILFDGLPPGSAIGTSSLRRQAEILSVRKDLKVIPVRGNVDTRLRKLREKAMDGLILAACGLERLGLAGQITEILDETRFPPAVGQGALAIEINERNAFVSEIAGSLNHPESFLRINAERAMLAAVEGGCQVPLGVSSRISGERLFMNAVLYSPEGVNQVAGEIEGAAKDAENLGKKLAGFLVRNGGETILRTIRGEKSKKNLQDFT